MAIGDAALAAGMDILTGNELANTLDSEENKTRDYIAGFAAGVRSIAAGGTGADNAATALANLGGIPTTDAADPGQIAATKLVRYTSNNRISTSNPIDPTHAATKAYADAVAGVPAAGGTFTGNVFYPNATAAASGYVVAYLNGDGRLSKGASSERYKEGIVALDPSTLGDLFPTLYSYRMIGSDTPHVGWIAERLDESDALRPFVVYARDVEYADDGSVTGAHLAADQEGNPVPESIDFIGLLIAQNAQLNQRLSALEADRASR